MAASGKRNLDPKVHPKFKINKRGFPKTFPFPKRKMGKKKGMAGPRLNPEPVREIIL